MKKLIKVLDIISDPFLSTPCMHSVCVRGYEWRLYNVSRAIIVTLSLRFQRRCKLEFSVNS